MMATQDTYPLVVNCVSHTATGWKEQSGVELGSGSSVTQMGDRNVMIYFLPRVESNAIQGNQAFRQNATRDFSLPWWFWDRQGWDSNGFYGYVPKLAAPEGTFTSYSRFLIKELVHGKEDTYEWQFLAFATRWHQAGPTEKPKQVILCFDLSSEMASWVSARFTEMPPDWLSCPLGVYSVLAGVIVSRFDSALWGFRAPVRKIEKDRSTDNMANRFSGMHELARHITHETEVLDVAARTLSSILRSQRDYCEGFRKTSVCTESHRSIEVSEQLIQNLGLRARAFDKRLRNEIKLAFNLSAADDNATAKKILDESRSDGRDLTKLVSTMTLLFLPASFVSGFFGMNFFNYEDSMVQVSTSVWVFFAATIPVTALAFASWQFFRARSAMRHQDVEDLEMPNKALLRRSTTARVG